MSAPAMAAARAAGVLSAPVVEVRSTPLRRAPSPDRVEHLTRQRDDANTRVTVLMQALREVERISDPLRGPVHDDEARQQVAEVVAGALRGDS